MGKVWGGCTWSGCEIDWLKHCTDYHAERMFAAEEAQLRWLYPLNGKERGKSVMGFYIFQAFGETFNLYHIYDRLQAKSKWTMVCASKRDEKAFRSFAFQVELFDPEDASRLLMQRHGCHGERDEDVLEEARCVCIDLGEVMRFMTADKVSRGGCLMDVVVGCGWVISLDLSIRSETFYNYLLDCSGALRCFS